MSKQLRCPFFCWTPLASRRRIEVERTEAAARRRISVVLAALVMAGVVGGCAVATAPYDWLPTVDHLAADPYGAWIVWPLSM